MEAYGDFSIETFDHVYNLLAFSNSCFIAQRIESHREKVVQRIVERGCEMLSKSSLSVFRICSIGCGDGKLDQQVLSKIREKFPNVRIHFCAFDVNELFVEHAKKSLQQLNNVEVEVLTGDIESVGNEFAPCDLVLCVSVLYYVKSLEQALSNLLQLVKNDGEFSDQLKT